MAGGRGLQVGVVGLALAGAFLPVDPVTVERWFSTGVYPPAQSVITSISNAVPFALLDVFTIAAVVALLVTLVAAVREIRRRRSVAPALRAGWRLLVAAAAIYLAFLALWGFNYRRVGIADRLVVQPGTPTMDDVATLGIQAAEQLNALYSRAHERGWRHDEWLDEGLRSAFHDVQRVLTDAPPAQVGRLKRTMYGPYFRWTGVDGMVNPLALEVLANPDLLPFERPFVAVHEWAHLAGYADEAAANFIAWVTCMRGDVATQYSGWLYLYWQVQGEVDADHRDRISQVLDAGPRADVNAIAERLRQGQRPQLRRVSWLAYDRYLKANRVEEGVRSYGAVITLILRASFEDGWLPVRRPDVEPSS
jgi:hypothetical protein